MLVAASSGLRNLEELSLRSNPLDCFAYCSVIPAIKEKNRWISILYDPRPDDCGCEFFRRGDANADGKVDVADIVGSIDDLFPGFLLIPPADDRAICSDAADANDDGVRDVSDVVYLANFLFAGGPVPPAPFSECAFDPTDDDLTCLSFEGCQ